MSLKYKEDCPIRRTLRVLGGKWPLLVLFNAQQPVRYGELKKSIPDISEKMLIHTLKELQEFNLISRKNYNTIPPKVVYTITDRGKKALDALPILIDAVEN